MAIPDAVHILARDLGEIFGARLQSLVAYGLADARQAHGEAAHARDASHDASQGASHDEPDDTHTLAIVDALTLDDLRACAGRTSRWQEAGLATPLLLAARELERSLDAFPFEFGAMLADHVVVAGRNPFDGLAVDPTDLRRACELQARSHLLHLREGFLEARGRADALAVLIEHSAAPFAALLRSIARLEGVETHDNAGIGRHVERRLDLSGDAITEVVNRIGAPDISSGDATKIFPGYLHAVERLVQYVDGWSRR